ncbi:protein NPAT isoform X2 [Ambystoma mexicanum]|uniref:protein NPAT isoform X2 n=1 Tax=Ambystoma mexicanum TaxID=8296 RepID=UPI0037E96917
MLLPSDIARLVLGYLQQEKLASTCSAFIAESPDLKEYAEHYTDEGFVPGCLLSLFGKNLIAILNEYVSMKAKEQTSEVPAMISSLWKKLEYTLSQIRSMQNSAAFSAHQRARTRNGIADMRRQRTLEYLSASSCSSLPSGPYASTPQAVKQVTLQCALQAKANPLFIPSSEMQENSATTNIGVKPASAVVSGRKDRKYAKLMGLGRRKSDSQKRKPSSAVRKIDSSSVTTEEQSDPLQELIDGNFPKLVIENARDKFLSNKSLQEKLAENINKFLGSDANIAQASRHVDSSVTEADTAIDEILGLEGGEIHMSDEAIQDILQQTESDPAFQALFDLFDYGKIKDGKKTIAESSTENEDLLNESAVVDDYPDSSKSFAIDHGGKDVTNASKNVSSQIGDTANNTADGALQDTLESSLEKDGDGQKETASSTIHFAAKICSSTTKHSNKCGQEKENKTQMTVGLHLEKEAEKPSIGLLQVHNGKQICEIQASTSEPDIMESIQQYNPLDKNGSPSMVSNSNPTSRKVVTESDTTMETENELSPNEQHLPALGHKAVEQHSVVTSNTEIEPISSTKGSGKNIECQPDLLNITPLSEDAYTKPFIAVPVKLFRSNDPKVSITTNHSYDCSKSPKDLDAIPTASPQTVQQSPDHQINAEDSSADSVECSLLKKSSCEPRPEEKQLQIAESETLDAQEPAEKILNSVTTCINAPTATLLKEPAPSTEAETIIESLSCATSTTEKVPLITCTESSTLAPVQARQIVTASENVFTIIDSSTVPITGSNVPSSSGQPDGDPSGIMSLNIIIRDESSRTLDTELNNAVSSISGENIPTIILSSPSKIQVQSVGVSQSASTEEAVTSSERISDVVFVDQCLPVHGLNDPASSTLSFKTEDGTVFSVAPNLSKDGGLMQLMPSTSTSFGQSSNVYITTCMTDNGSFRNTVTPSKITPIAAKTQSQVQTPPRPRNLFAVGQALSPKVSQGSTIIFASPVQPAMLQMGMIPLSVVGQNRNTYSAFPGQLLRMPATNPLGSRGIPKQHILPKNTKAIGSKSTIHTGRMSKRKEEVLNPPVLFHPQRLELSETILPTDGQKKTEECSFLMPPTAPGSNTKVSGGHRRVLCFEDSALPDSDEGSSQVTNKTTASQNKERPDSLLHSLQAAVGASKFIKTMQSNDSSKTGSNSNHVGESNEVNASRVSISSGANKENKLTQVIEPQHKQESPKLMTNQDQITFCYDKTVPLVKEMSRKGILPNIIRKSPYDPRKEVGKSHLISPLRKQAGEMLQDIQLKSPPDSGDLPQPRTPSCAVAYLDSVRTPTCKNPCEEGGTPKAILLPATPEFQGCSPASEAGSENSVSMAAHTLMILSRASIANTGSTTPLKDNTHQIKSRSTSKKRKLEDTEERERTTRLSKKESPPTPLKKKKIKVFWYVLFAGSRS